MKTSYYYTKELLSTFDDIAADREKWYRRNAYYHNALKRIYRFYIPENQSVCEIGSSVGDLLAALKPSKGIGIDISETAVERAKERHSDNESISFHQANVEAYISDEKYDYVIMSDVIGYLGDIQTAFEKVRALMHPHSRLVINFYNFVWEPVFRLAQWLGLKKKQPPQNWLSNDDVVNLLELAGFDVIRKEGFILFPKNIPLISPIVNGFFAKLPLLRHFTVAQFIVARPHWTPSREQAENYTVSVIVPARNEAGNIENAVTRTPQMGAWTEFIFVEGGSSDNTYEEMLRVQEKYPDLPITVMKQDGKGKKDAVYKGYQYAKGDILMILDSDLTMPPEDLPKYYNTIAYNKGEYINGVRLVYPMEDEAMRLLNLYANKTFSLLFSYILGQPYKDTLCGTKVLWKKDWERIKENRSYFGDFDPYGDFDIIFGAEKLSLKSIQMPVRYRERTYGEIQISRFSGGWLLLKMTIIGFIKFKWKLR